MNTLSAQGRPVRVLVSGMSALMASGIKFALESSDELFVETVILDDLPETDVPPIDIVVTDYHHGIRYAGAQCRHGASKSLKNARVFVLSADSIEHDIRLALELGVYGYAMASLGIQELVVGVRAVSRGERFICSASAKQLAESMSRDALTARETGVLRELARGSCNKVIAKELNVSVGTIKSHVRALMEKLDANTRTQVVICGITRGLVSTPKAMEQHDFVDSASSSLLIAGMRLENASHGAQIRN